MNLISVIIPVFNAEHYLEDCVNSVLSQTYQNLEIILVDDGSSDNSLEKCNGFADGKRVIAIHQDNQGVSVARNKGLQHATGEYVVFVDADDILTPDSIEFLYNLIRIDNVDFAQGRFDFLYGQKRVPRKHLMKKGSYFTKDILSEMLDNGKLSGFLIGSSCGAIYSMNIIKGHNIQFLPGLSNNEDGLFNLEYFIHTQSIVISDECVYIVRKHNESATSISHLEDTYNKQVVDYITAHNWSHSIENLQIQIKRRNVTVALWAILRNPRSMCFYDGVKYINGRIDCIELRDSLQYIDVKNLRSYKKLIFYLMKYKLSIMLCLFVKYLIPFLNSKVKR